MEKWLNGWYRNGATVLLGPNVHCAGCGKFFGIACVAPLDNGVVPNKEPDYPFPQEDCPVCQSTRYDLTLGDLTKLPIGLLRQALATKKSPPLAQP